MDRTEDLYHCGPRDMELIVCVFVCVCLHMCRGQAESLESGGYRGALRPQEIHRDRQAERVKAVRESRGDCERDGEKKTEGGMMSWKEFVC